MTENRHRLVCMVVSAFLFVCAGWNVAPTQISWSADDTYPAPNFSLMSTGNTWVSLGDFSGMKVILVFWEPGCDICMELIREFNMAYSDMDQSKYAIVGIDVEKSSIEAVRETTEKLGITFPILKGGPGTMQDYNVYDLPTTFLIDGNGNITHIYIGGADVESIVNEVQGLEKD